MVVEEGVSFPFERHSAYLPSVLDFSQTSVLSTWAASPIRGLEVAHLSHLTDETPIFLVEWNLGGMGDALNPD